MSNTLRQAALLALATFISAGSATAQALPPGGAPSAADQAAFAELQQTQQQLGQLQVQAIGENAELEARRSSIDEMLITAMSEIDPATQQNIDRLDILSQEAIAAQQAQDGEALDALMTEATRLRTDLESAQAQALAQEDIQAEIEVFETELMASVLQIDPEAGALLERIETLSAQLGVPSPGGE